MLVQSTIKDLHFLPALPRNKRGMAAFKAWRLVEVLLQAFAGEMEILTKLGFGQKILALSRGFITELPRQ